ncbi:MAG: HD domain-containing protein, partial [Armatimonadia bacterium]|nr:HD domain-containing protein [Armatimonadia bacterium]
PHLSALLQRFLSSEDITPQLERCPAAKGLHHAYLGGLVEHILGCLYMARNACKVHKALDRSLVYAGIVLHDIGKIQELSVTTHIDYSVPGRLVGHVVLGYQWVMAEADALEDFPEETRMQLGHIILSHHGQHEFGAPVLPMTPEAIAVHFIENADAQTNRYLSAVGEAREDDQDFTSFDRLLGRHLYARPRT